MAYTNINFKSKAAIKRAIAEGTKITCYDPGIGLEKIPSNGTISLCSPHFPEPHKWYGTGTIKDGILIKIK